MKKDTPTGFIAICRCGAVVGAMDFTRTHRKDAGKILGNWFFNGCTVQPKFNGSWSAKVDGCKCDYNQANSADPKTPLPGELYLGEDMSQK